MIKTCTTAPFAYKRMGLLCIVEYVHDIVLFSIQTVVIDKRAVSVVNLV